MLEKIRAEHWKDGVEIVAINMMPQVPLSQWEKYLNYIGLKSALVAVDNDYSAINACKVRTAGATLVINKKGHLIYRDRSASTYEELKFAVSMAL